jgi:hypothetical protein
MSGRYAMLSRLIRILCLAGLLCILATGCSSGGGNEIDVPVEVRTDQEVVAVAFEILYDPLVLEAVSVSTSTLATGADAAYDTSRPGILLVVVANATKLDRDGTLVVAHFRILDDTASSDLRIDFKAAEAAGTGQPLPFDVADGRFEGSDRSVRAPVISIG